MAQNAYDVGEFAAGAPVTDQMIWLTRWGLGNSADCPLTHFDVLDARGNTVGVIKSMWPEQASRQHEYIVVRLNWNTSTVSIVPAAGMQVDNGSATVQVPFTEEQIRHSPSYELQSHRLTCA